MVRGIVPPHLDARDSWVSASNWGTKMERNASDQGARIDELEASLAQQEHSILALSHELYQQQQNTAQLEIQVRHLADLLKTLASAEPGTFPGNEKPPHY